MCTIGSLLKENYDCLVSFRLLKTRKGLKYFVIDVILNSRVGNGCREKLTYQNYVCGR